MTNPMALQSKVIASIDQLAGFPRVVSEILATLDDVDANLSVLVGYIRQEPMVAARVLSSANKAAAYSRAGTTVRDLFTAISLIGLSRVREMALIGSISPLLKELAPNDVAEGYWRHSISVAICAEELARFVEVPVSGEMAIISGLLHDLGQLWLLREFPAEHAQARQSADSLVQPLEHLEKAQWGVDHAQIGAWMAEHWQLPTPICHAIAHHHAPDGAPGDTLAALLHVAEALAQALDLSRSRDNRVTNLSPQACRQLGLVWNDRCQPLFGRMEARYRQVNALFAESPD